MTSTHHGPEDSARPFDMQTFLDDFMTGLEPGPAEEQA